MKKTIEVTAHLFFWFVFTLFVLMLAKIYLQAKPDAAFSGHLAYIVFLELVMGVIFFYTTFFGIALAGKNNKYRFILTGILIFLLILFAWPALHFGIWQVLSSVVPHIIVIFLAVVFRKFSDSIRMEKEKQELMLQNTRSELALLKMQISPHFLFNTLNNIDYLITKDSSKASVSISKLGDILRYMIYDARVDKISLAAELKHIQDYIELVRLRALDENYIVLSINGNAGHLQIAPMLCIPLIENACKHASDRDGRNIIEIRIEVNDNELYFNVNNEFNIAKKTEATDANGIGLNLVKRRLELIYQGKHHLNLSQINRRYTAELRLELDEY
jgi:two-component system, LytTR family, sensor kinase